MGVNPFGRVTRETAWAWAVAGLVANIAIVVTGGLVRLTGSGLGCPTWPQCTDGSFTPPVSELGWHSEIEFGNRMVTWIVAAVAVGTVVAVYRWADASRTARWVAALILAGIPLQAVIGGVSVLSGLNPWIVALHFMVSMALIAGSVTLVHELGERSEVTTAQADQRLIGGLFLLTWIVIYLGTVVTGSGPHAGDESAPRNGLDSADLSHLHAFAVWILVALTVVIAVRLWRNAARNAVLTVLVVEVAQGALGYTQYYLGLPIWLVELHMFGAALLMATVTRLSVTTRP